MSQIINPLHHFIKKSGSRRTKRIPKSLVENIAGNFESGREIFESGWEIFEIRSCQSGMIQVKNETLAWNSYTYKWNTKKRVWNFAERWWKKS